MRILIACEYSGVIRDAFAAKNHDVMSCDLLPTDKPGKHYQGNVMDIINDGWDMIIAHPPCTFMCNSGVKHLHTDAKRWIKLFEAGDFFKQFLDADIPKIVIENPIMHKYGKKLIGGIKQSQVIQPWMFGHTEQKATCLWIKGLPLLTESNNVKKEMMALPKKERERVHHLPPSQDRWKLRSTTYQGIADAMAAQWG
ncbi:MAG: hypothetical protein KAT04_15420 [Methylococcales bacterium]|nr:hypothetical protein [Methylococcales bacterium]